MNTLEAFDYIQQEAIFTKSEELKEAYETLTGSGTQEEKETALEVCDSLFPVLNLSDFKYFAACLTYVSLSISPNNPPKPTTKR